MMGWRLPYKESYLRGHVDQVSDQHHTVILAEQIADRVAEMVKSGTIPAETDQQGVFAHYTVDGNTTELGVWIRDFAGKAVGNVTTFAADPSDPGNVNVTQGTSDVPAEVVPFGLVDRARCFLASRKLVKAMQQGGSANKEEAVLNYARACNAAFLDTTT